MKIVTTPMCEEILKWNGIKKYTVNKFPDKEDNVNLAILLSESKTKHPALYLKLNTFQQIKNSILKTSQKLNTNITNTDIELIIKEYPQANNIIKKLEEYRKNNNKINVKVYSNFLKDIAKDLGFNLVEDNSDFIIYPDYIKTPEKDSKLIKIPTHNNVPNNPIERATLRYLTIINNIR